MQINKILRQKPMLWAGIATAAGLGLGIAGRIIRRRRQRLPTILILKAC